jgi:putative ABC transport system permease protein
MRQAIFITLGLAVGIGLVITVTAASAGVKKAQATVLHSLYGVGTDITVTKTPTAGSGGPGSFGFAGRSGSSTKNNSSSTSISVDRLASTAYGSLSTSYVDKIKSLSGVSATSGALVLTDTKFSGSIGANFGSGSGSGSGGGTGGSGSGAGSSSGSTTRPKFNGNFNNNSITVDGVDLASYTALGPLSSAKLASGSAFTSSDTDSYVALISQNYATANKLKVGSTVTLAKKKFTVIGIASLTSTTDVYIPLTVAQTLASMKNEVNTIYVSATNNNSITTVAKTIKSTVSGSTVTDESSLASEVTGSLSSASSLLNSLGKWVAIAVLLAAFLLASLLTMSAVSRRIREFGTLKALGWKSGRVIGQVMGESIVTGILGGVIGIALGFGGAQLVDHFAGSLSATVGSTSTTAASGAGAAGGPGGGGAPGGGFGRAASTASTVSVHLAASVTIGAIIAAVLLAVAGGLIAGGFGGWRAARLRPAAALSKVA